MRQVRIISTKFMTPEEMEAAINAVMKDIHDNGGYVDKTEYGIDHGSGRVGMAVIEYE